ncbi:MAG: hypothetical protein ACOCXI_04740 [Chloroflexota bacterium]
MSGLEAAAVVLGLIILRFALPMLITIAVGFISNTILRHWHVTT